MPRSLPPSSKRFRHTLFVIVICLLPIVVLALVVTSGPTVSPWLFLAFLVACFLAMYYAMGRTENHPAPDARLLEREQESASEPVLESLILKVSDLIHPVHTYGLENQYVIEGLLLGNPGYVFDQVQDRFAATEWTPLLQESGEGRSALVLAPRRLLDATSHRPSHPWVNLGLLIGTLMTTTWAGAAHRGVDLLAQPERYAVGLPYAIALLLILGVHEMGHYLIARRNGMAVSLPYFIPVPFTLGTFGAFIRMKSLARDRRAMFDVAVAGPIGGMIIAIPALLIGLPLSIVTQGGTDSSMLMGGSEVGSSMLFAFLAKASLGDALLEGHRLILHPVAFAGWLGLLLTALNLIPVGQLDGGHMAHALLGRTTARTVGVVALVSLVILGLFVWSALLFWAILIFFIAGTSDVPPRNDVSRAGRGRVVVGAAAFLLLLLILLPVPHALYDSFGIHCPYV